MAKQTEPQARGAVRGGLSSPLCVSRTLTGITCLLGISISLSELLHWNLAPRQGSEPRVAQTSGASWCRGGVQTGKIGLGHFHFYFLVLDFQRTRGTCPGTGITPPPIQMCHNLFNLSSGQIQRCFCLSGLRSMFAKHSEYSQGGCHPFPEMCWLGMCKGTAAAMRKSEEEKTGAPLHKMVQDIYTP